MDLPGEKQVYYPLYQVDFVGSLSSLIVALCCIIQIYLELRNIKFGVYLIILVLSTSLVYHLGSQHHQAKRLWPKWAW